MRWYSINVEKCKLYLLKVIHFPTYALELNHQEHVWKSRNCVNENGNTHTQRVMNGNSLDDIAQYFTTQEQEDAVFFSVTI